MQKKRNIIKLNDTYNEADTIKYIKSYMFIKGFAVAKNLKQTLIALAVARHFHDGQYRKDGMPYIVHPLKVCTTLMNYGIDDDVTLAAALLHDLLEDCSDKLPLKGRELITEYHLSHHRLWYLPDSSINDMAQFRKEYSHMEDTSYRNLLLLPSSRVYF